MALRGPAEIRYLADRRPHSATLQARGIPLVSAADESSTGPASLMLIDPDGNPILIDQHVPKPKP